MHIIFSHGKEGKPDGKKIVHLAQIASTRGHTSESIDYTDTKNPDIRAARLSDIVEQQQQPFCLVGSSMGGYASLLAAERADKHLLRGVFLMAPALYLPTYQQQHYTAEINRIEVVHGWDDSVVLCEHSIRYAREVGCTLHLVSDNHRFSCNTQYVYQLFENFLKVIEEQGITGN